MPQSSQIKVTQGLKTAHDLLAYELLLLEEVDQLRVLSSALRIAEKLAKLSPEMRRQTPIHGLLEL